ncbi:Dam family site-specific DNA-(adenine-N6)-methyltransferase [Francisella philomiragia]|uniref:Site-specific DNA-methyltransferase (adenine-specific) n=1 Tax=Francisella philomiragia TaxID=28110 RepID=A0AAW3DDK9_9GAMM|nr:Dam family site-specific DNA-(adenine-N6)-methyltransferase [Francisella philomiragia]KFJ43532.1 DNA adenine methylase family protein [Francisella philomiragia]KFJ43975.1 DNA adenine methylase family protein [Francisella philomiragia]MBK2255719.1 Dam family site-specific DNA-(adenine-N6)-methyltransferase [Francisella philomiragia]MBK2274028.1 Dam family site-specific DNA-(adenine-N6)-methyltransferase [Francisella philomiragia]MBK2277875.1 Dam family site-specific DNA-(adenine-N6)-methyltr
MLYQSLDIESIPKGFANTSLYVRSFKQQLLKWVGNKQRFADEIISYFPNYFGTYFEPFLGSGAVLGTLSPRSAVGSDTFAPLIEIWDTLKNNPEVLKQWYFERWSIIGKLTKKEAYEKIKDSYNNNPNGADFLFLSRSCYGGVIRFRKQDGVMSTPCGAHTPMSPDSFNKRVDIWHKRISNTSFYNMDYLDIMSMAKKGDLIYCDPPYSFSQAILYGAQNFSLEVLLEKIAECKNKGIYVALSIDGSKKSGNFICDIKIPTGLFEREISVNCGKSMLKRFQMEGKNLDKEIVTDRLLLTY